jgi:hypothetical protein
MWKALFLFAGLTIVVLGWGYYHVSTHANLNVSIYDVSLKNDRQAYGNVVSADLAFTNAAGTILAKARADKPLGTVSIYHPDSGDCRKIEQEASSSREGMAAWQKCYETKSRWFVTWARQVRFASVNLAHCTIDRVPVSIEESREDWWLWWVPLPHIGGAPYTYFNLALWIDSGSCGPASR